MNDTNTKTELRHLKCLLNEADRNVPYGEAAASRNPISIAIGRELKECGIQADGDYVSIWGSKGHFYLVGRANPHRFRLSDNAVSYMKRWRKSIGYLAVRPGFETIEFWIELEEPIMIDRPMNDRIEAVPNANDNQNVAVGVQPSSTGGDASSSTNMDDSRDEGEVQQQQQSSMVDPSLRDAVRLYVKVGSKKYVKNVLLLYDMAFCEHIPSRDMRSTRKSYNEAMSWLRSQEASLTLMRKEIDMKESQ